MCNPVGFYTVRVIVVTGLLGEESEEVMLGREAGKPPLGAESFHVQWGLPWDASLTVLPCTCQRLMLSEKFEKRKGKTMVGRRPCPDQHFHCPCFHCSLLLTMLATGEGTPAGVGDPCGNHKDWHKHCQTHGREDFHVYVCLANTSS